MILARLKMVIYSRLCNQHYFFNWLNNTKPRNDFFIIQIGANDGKRDDPVYNFIRKWNVTGLLIEPNPEVFKKLKETYSDNPKLIFENIAISDRAGQAELWYYKPQGKMEEWHSLISTFELGKGFSSIVGDEDNWKAMQVESITLDDIIIKHGILEIDLLVEDTEGHDYKILSTYSFTIKPRAIYYEHSNITYNENFRLQEKLINLGYRLFVEKSNTLALLK